MNCVVSWLFHHLLCLMESDNIRFQHWRDYLGLSGPSEILAQNAASEPSLPALKAPHTQSDDLCKTLVPVCINADGHSHLRADCVSGIPADSAGPDSFAHQHLADDFSHPQTQFVLKQQAWKCSHLCICSSVPLIGILVFN